MGKSKFFALLFFCFITRFVDANSADTLKIFRTNEVIVLSEDDEIRKSSASREFVLSDIGKSKYKTIDEILNEVVGFYSLRNSKNEGYFRLRGFDQRQVGIYFDGVPIVSQFDGMVDLSQFATPLIAKIAVSKGLSTVLYGANNLAGSVNFVTENSFSKNKIETTAELGNISKNFGLAINQRISDFYFFASVDYLNLSDFNVSRKLKSLDFVENSDFNSLNVFFKVANSIGNSFQHSFSTTLSLGNKGIPFNLEAKQKRYWKMPEWRNLLTNYAFDWVLTDNLFVKSQIYYTDFYNVIDSYDDSTYTTQNSKSAFHSTQRNRKLGLSAIFEYKLSNSNLTKFGFRYNDETQKQQANVSEPFKAFRSELLSISLEQNFSFNDFGGLIGLNWDIFNPNKDNPGLQKTGIHFLNYQAGVNYSIHSFNVYLNYAHKSRFPTLKELYAEILGTNKPNPALKSEFADLFELGINSISFDNLKLRASFYYDNVRNLIDIITLEDKSRQFVNIGKVFFSGVELEGKYSIKKFDFTFGAIYQKVENRTSGASTKILPLRPEISTNLVISRLFSFGLKLELQLIGYFNQYAFNSDKKQYFELPDYGLVNLSTSYKLNNHITISGYIKNLFDVLYYSDWGYPQPGINFLVGINLIIL